MTQYGNDPRPKPSGRSPRETRQRRPCAAPDKVGKPSGIIPYDLFFESAVDDKYWRWRYDPEDVVVWHPDHTGTHGMDPVFSLAHYCYMKDGTVRGIPMLVVCNASVPEPDMMTRGLVVRMDMAFLHDEYADKSGWHGDRIGAIQWAQQCFGPKLEAALVEYESKGARHAGNAI